MRRAIIGLLAALLLLTLPACGGGSSAGGAAESRKGTGGSISGTASADLFLSMRNNVTAEG